MITKDPMHLNVYIKKKATEKHISAELYAGKTAGTHFTFPL